VNLNQKDLETPIVVLCPEPDAVSETFIRAHLALLPFTVIPLFRWRSPYQTINRKWLALIPSLVARVADRLRWPYAIRFAEHWAHRQTAAWLRFNHAQAVLAEYGPLGAGIAPACRFAGIPLVVIFHGFDAYLHDTLFRYRELYTELFASDALLVAVSQPMRQQLIHLGASPDRIIVNPCGVDPLRFFGARPGTSTPHFLSIGRFVDKKGPMLTIESFARAHQEESSCRLTMIGTGPLLPECQMRALALGLNGVITFVGACPHDSVQAHLRRVRAVVQHSIRCPSGDQEGTPVALIEAQMAGLPVVSTLHAGIPGVVVNGRTGFLVQEGDVDGMAEAMIKLARDPRLAAEMGAAGRAHALKHHTMERHINSLAATIREAISRHPTASPS
jgi:colanic acid/amylovoran biosynthesis glycosyltransferase